MIATVKSWSDKQTNIFDRFINFYLVNLVVRARAGTGKTTTIVEAIKRLLAADPTRKIIVAAFGKAIADELVTRFAGYDVTVKTLHALGLQCVKRFWPRVKVSFDSTRADALAEAVCGPSVPNDIKKLVAKLHTKGREITAHARTLGDLTDIALRFECEPGDEWTACASCGASRDAHVLMPADTKHDYYGFDLVFVEQKALDAMELAASAEPVKTGIDGSDMLFLPVRNHWLRKMCQDIVVDEAQDMNPTQLEIATTIAERVIVVGDDKQAIYAFRGADSDALDRLKRELHAEELPLNITYRCAKSIVREAQRLVPDFEAGDDNPEGEVLTLDVSRLTTSAAAGDFILSRVNAPLVSIAMALLRSGKRTRIAGRDIGKGLITLVRKMRARSIPDLLTKIDSWKNREIARLDAKFPSKLQQESSTYIARYDAICDQAEMLSSLTDNATSVTEVETRIEALFTDDGLGQAGMITCSSVHRAKGLEADRVFVLADTLRDGNDEERNITYVAITRAKSSLVYVTNGAQR